MRYAVVWGGLLCLLVSCALGGESDSARWRADSDFKPIAADATVDQVLDSLKVRGDTLRDFSADVKMTTVDNSTADSSAESGNVKFQKLADGDARIRITFDKKLDGDKTFPEKHEFTLAGGWLTDRDYLKKPPVEIRRQVLRPGQKINLLKLGEGPFPLPIGQDKIDVKKQFDVSKIDAAKDDPAGSIHLLLKPKAGSDFARKFTQIEVWVDRTTGMPVRIATTDNTGNETRTTDLTNLRLNQGLDDKDFALPKVEGWDQTEEPYHE